MIISAQFGALREGRMSLEELSEKAIGKDERNKWVAVFIAVMAVLLAICNVGGANATKDATHANIELSDIWVIYQAKMTRRTSTLLSISELELMLAAQPGMPEEAKKKFADKIAEYRAEAERLRSNPKTGDGTYELYVKAKQLEANRDVALRKAPYFDRSQVLLQIAIVLASVYLIVGSIWLLALSGGLAGLGLLLMLNGFTLAVG